eukprot:CAMPEP_0174698484 /NCGR_PEP_ID=MMETSP1094-20130205/4079_1 /TAXON_ID=156173 /ORGANISM="Chrysochromulina brevifilum, Strain UTEX LB 985" /LENGTH=75 /DNA_ID=CAMNT_0015895673 /DNA_START=149 /DNA_END=376 /DNA_ORIENTATION=-
MSSLSLASSSSSSSSSSASVGTLDQSTKLIPVASAASYSAARFRARSSDLARIASLPTRNLSTFARAAAARLAAT